jgi:2-polyprenyl-3-methyl-5-hydroxy-6-metoxy-1,4-benzoquinol methylase
MDNRGCKTERAYWEANSQKPIKFKLPSMLNIDVLNMTRLLKQYVKPSHKYLEIGCAPGKMLAWVAGRLKAEVEGLDYSEPGIAQCQKLFNVLGLKVILHQEDFFNHHISQSSFDIVTSFGVIEHFDNAQLAVRKHFDLVKPGGVAVIVIPNYGGIYGRLQHWFDSSNIKLHNIEIMNLQGLKSLADSLEAQSSRVYTFGSMSPWLVNFDKRLPGFAAKVISLGINVIGLLQPFTIKSMAPLLVLEIRKGSKG